MAQTKSSASAPKQDIEQLSAQIDTLKKDISAITRTLSELSSSTRDATVESLRSHAAELRDRGQENIRQARSHAEDLGHQAADAVRNQPAAAVGLAVGLGFLLGFMTGRK